MYKRIFRKVLYVPRWILLGVIMVYQKTLSPDHGLIKSFFPHGYCKFYPSCSMYGYNVIHKHGILRGVPKAFYRIVRCNPLSKGGIDLPD